MHHSSTRTEGIARLQSLLVARHQQCHSHNNKINLVVVLLCFVYSSLGGSSSHHAHFIFAIAFVCECWCRRRRRCRQVIASRRNAAAYENSFIQVAFCHSSGFKNGPCDDLRHDVAFHVSFSHSFDILSALFFLSLSQCVRVLLLPPSTTFFFGALLLLLLSVGDGWWCARVRNRQLLLLSLTSEERHF